MSATLMRPRSMMEALQIAAVRVRAQQMAPAKPARSLHDFSLAAWKHVDPQPFVDNWHIGAICEHLEAVTTGQIQRLVINIPPRHAKSLFTSVFWPVWTWTTNPALRWLFASYADDLSSRDARRARTLIESAWFRSEYGSALTLRPDQNQKTYYETTAGGYRMSTSVGARATGFGGDILVVDDPHNVIEAESDIKRANVLSWWDEAFFNRVNDAKTARRVLIMQRVHEADLAGHLLEQGGWEHLCLPTEWEGDRRVTGIGWSDPRTELGELLWPERFGEKEIAEYKTSLGPYAYAGQYQQNPVPRGKGLFKRAWLEHTFEREKVHPLKPQEGPAGGWGFEGINLDPPKPRRGMEMLLSSAAFQPKPVPKRMTIIQFLDTACDEDQEADWSVCATLGKIDDRILIMDLWREKVEFVELLSGSQQQIFKWHPDLVVIEKRSSGIQLVQQLRRLLRGTPILDVATQETKYLKAARATPYFADGRVQWPNTNPSWCDLARDELEKFPRGKNDDMVDAICGGVHYHSISLDSLIADALAQQAAADARADARRNP